MKLELIYTFESKGLTTNLYIENIPSIRTYESNHDSKHSIHNLILDNEELEKIKAYVEYSHNVICSSISKMYQTCECNGYLSSMEIELFNSELYKIISLLDKTVSDIKVNRIHISKLNIIIKNDSI